MLEYNYKQFCCDLGLAFESGKTFLLIELKLANPNNSLKIHDHD